METSEAKQVVVDCTGATASKCDNNSNSNTNNVDEEDDDVLDVKERDRDEVVVVLNEDISPEDTSAIPSPISAAAAAATTTTTLLPCEMCHNYETNLTKLQDIERNLREQLSASQHLADRYQTELSGERLYRNELESKMNAICGDSEKEARLASEYNQSTKDVFEQFQQSYERLKEDQSKKVFVLKERLKQLNEQMIELSQRYLKLLGTNRKCAAEMRAQTIELPSDVEQLQFACLQLKEELIETRAAKEHMESVLRDEITMLQVQRREDEIEKQRLERALTEQVNGVSEELGIARSELSTLHDASHKMEEMDKRMAEYRAVIEELERQVKSTHKERIDLEMTLNAYKQKCTALQQELDTSETVQKDFVKLSQNLQIELEKIRQAEQEVRWQFNDDVHACNQCHINFTKNASKLHCQHCGKIFCAQCLSYKVAAGPHARMAKVCKVCHTLLIRDSAPFFSHSDNDSA